MLGLAVIHIMESRPGIYRIDKIIINENTLAFLAQDKLESVKGQLINDFSATISPLSGTFSDFTGAENFHFVISSPVADGSRANLKVITVQVWYGSAGSYDAAENKIQLITKIASRA